MVKEILLADQHFHDLNPIICGHQECEPNHAFGPSTRFYWLLHYVVQGSGILFPEIRNMRCGQDRFL